MTEERQAYWQAYIDQLKPMMRLWQWRITVMPTVADDDNDATIETRSSYFEAFICLRDNWDSKPPEWQRCTLIHELVHLHVDRYSGLTSKLVGQLGAQAQYMGADFAHQLLEQSVDEIAHTLSPFLPLPPTDEPAAKSDMRQLAEALMEAA